MSRNRSTVELTHKAAELHAQFTAQALSAQEHFVLIMMLGFGLNPTYSLACGEQRELSQNVTVRITANEEAVIQNESATPPV